MKDTHHIFGQKRFPQWKNAKWNKVKVDMERHRLFNILFGGDRTPRECIAMLTREFFGGMLDPPEGRES